MNSSNESRRRPTRRAVLTTMGAATTAGLAGCLGDDDDGGGGTTDSGPADGVVRVGVSLPDSGGRTREATLLRSGYVRAAEDINGGSLDGPWDFGGLDQEIELVYEDTGGTREGAQKSAQRLVDAEARMLTGGASHGEALAHQTVADSAGIVHMSGFTPTNALGGAACSQYGFNEMYTAEIAAESLAPALGEIIGADQTVDFAQLQPDTPFGDQFARAFERRFSEIGADWNHIRADRAGPGRRYYEDPIESILAVEPDMLILDYYGLDGVAALQDFAKVADDDIELVVPIFGPQILEDTGDPLDGVFGTVHWDPAFSDVMLDEETHQYEHLAYVQLAQYAAAVSRAGSFNSDDVVSQLQGYEYNVGTGQQFFRCEQQAMRYAPVVQGDSSTSDGGPDNYQLIGEGNSALENTYDAVGDGSRGVPYSRDLAWNCALCDDGEEGDDGSDGDTR